MSFYSHRQLTLLLLLVVAAGAGLAVGHWRRAHPELAERLEQLDRAPVETAHPPGGGPANGDARAMRPPKRTAPAAEPLDPNRASAAELETLPGVGASLARRIVDARDRDGPFATVDDLRRVRGLSRGRLERLRPLLDVTP